jgi:hypothetical protein
MAIRFPAILKLLLISLIAMLSFSGCASMGVAVWDRDIMARPSMQLDRSTLDRELDDHVYFSKEAASGGRGLGGGGCGCN